MLSRYHLISPPPHGARPYGVQNTPALLRALPTQPCAFAFGARLRGHLPQAHRPLFQQNEVSLCRCLHAYSSLHCLYYFQTFQKTKHPPKPCRAKILALSVQVGALFRPSCPQRPRGSGTKAASLGRSAIPAREYGLHGKSCRPKMPYHAPGRLKIIRFPLRRSRSR